VVNPKRGGLGRGLGALIPGRADAERPPVPSDDTPAPPPAAVAAAPVVEKGPRGEHLVYLDPTTIAPNPKQPRKVFEEEALQELAASIKQDGVFEPVIVRKVGNDYELVSGERRVKASIMADLEKVPAVVREVNDRDMLKLGLIENIQREDLNAIETAEAYEQLLDEFHWTQEELAAQVGKNRATVTNTLRLLNLPQDVRMALSEGKITMGHAKAVLSVPHPAAQSALCRKIIALGLSVRQAEKLASEKDSAVSAIAGTAAKPLKPIDGNVAMVETKLRQRLGTKVALKPTGKGGKIEIEYYSGEDLERILDILNGR
jgi:ParB family chromosome partitioning protein